MTLPELNPAGYKYRQLAYPLVGWDVYALQTGLKKLGYIASGVEIRGVFGSRTRTAVKAFQDEHKLTGKPMVTYGWAGIVTQTELTKQLIWPVQKEQQLPAGLMRGQIESESSFIVGNHSVLHPPIKRVDPPTFDVGVCQLNTPQDANYLEFFDMAHSIATLGGHYYNAPRAGLRDAYEEYKGFGVVKDERRLWELASGSWNAPAWTRTLAKGGSLTDFQREHIEGYIDRTTRYMVI